MSENKGLIQMLAQCEKSEFDDVVKSYLKAIYKTKTLVVTDGKNDGGLDVKVMDMPLKKLQFQMTIQKSSTANERKNLEAKILADVAKAQKNVENYGYSDRLEFFYSYPLTEDFIEKIQMQAFVNYGINLVMLDAKRIAAQAQNNPELYKSILTNSGYNTISVKTKEISDKDKLFYDLVGFGEAADVKLKIVEAYILQCLFDEGQLTKDELINKCMRKFRSSENEQFYSKLLNRLHSRENRISYDHSEMLYKLTENEYLKISDATKKNNLDESLFLSSIKKVLENYHQEKNLEEYINLLYSSYIHSFELRLSQDSQNTIEDAKSIVHFATQQLKDEILAKNMVGEMLKICDENKYIQRNCAGKVFSSTIDIDTLKNYADNKKRVFVDTTLPLHMLCFFNHPVKDVKNYYYLLSRSMFEFCKKRNIQLYMTRTYFKEVVCHVREAIDLVPYSKIPGIEQLGGSKNVFYNFYYHLRRLGKLEDLTYFDYLNDMKFRNYPMQGTLEQELELQLNNIGIRIIDVSKKYDIDNTRKLLDLELIATGKNKSQFGLNDDAIMMCFLADRDIEIHPVDPIFVTWDRTLFKVMPSFFNHNPIAQRWMQFTPSQFIDRYSLLTFSVNEETISKEMLAMLSGDIEERTNSLLDSLSLILNPDDQMGRKYIDKLAAMKDNKIYMTNRKSDAPQEEMLDDSLDSFMNSLTTHYKKSEGGLSSLKSLFSKAELMDDVIKLIADNITEYLENKKFLDTMYTSFDELIKINIIQKKDL